MCNCFLEVSAALTPTGNFAGMDGWPFRWHLLIVFVFLAGYPLLMVLAVNIVVKKEEENIYISPKLLRLLLMW